MAILLRNLLVFTVLAGAWGPVWAHQVWIQTVSGPGRLAVHGGFGEPDHWDRRNVRKIEQTR